MAILPCTHLNNRTGSSFLTSPVPPPFSHPARDALVYCPGTMGTIRRESHTPGQVAVPGPLGCVPSCCYGCGCLHFRKPLTGTLGLFPPAGAPRLPLSPSVPLCAGLFPSVHKHDGMQTEQDKQKQNLLRPRSSNPHPAHFSLPFSETWPEGTICSHWPPAPPSSPS